MQNIIGNWKLLSTHSKDPKVSGLKVFSKVYLGIGPTLNWAFRVEDPKEELSPDFTRIENWIPSNSVIQGKELWRENCFEIFLKPHVGHPNYFEWNFMVPNKWDFYCFHGPRLPSEEGKKLFTKEALTSPIISAKPFPANFEVSGQIQLSQISLMNWIILNNPTSCLINICCILKTKSGESLHFSLVHPDPAKPDFHNELGFILLEKAASNGR